MAVGKDMDNEQKIRQLVDILNRTSRVAVLTGAGISAESGIPTFRGEEGLWKNFRAEQLATPQAFAQNPDLVWEWYDWRRGIIGSKDINDGHRVLSKWESIFPTYTVITQNIDGFHAKAGSTKIVELHGNIWKMRCTEEGTVSENYETPLKELPPRCPNCGAMLRPHVVWFGESLEQVVIQQAFALSSSCELIFVIGTSAVVQPAASLPITAADAGAKIVEINPDPTPLTVYTDFTFRGNSGEILPLIDKELSQALQH
jgi:NAD-dependent deacetylase